MAEILTDNHKRKGVRRLIKKATRVDLTPMVDLGFLLITFFVFTSTMAKPKMMKIDEPIVSDITTALCNSCVLTVLLDKDNSIKYYEGNGDDVKVLLTTDYSAGGIRKIITDKKQKVKAVRGSAAQFSLIIKPTALSRFQNYIDMVDEASINDVKRYFVAEMDDKDIALLAHK